MDGTEDDAILGKFNNDVTSESSNEDSYSKISDNVDGESSTKNRY